MQNYEFCFEWQNILYVFCYFNGRFFQYWAREPNIVVCVVYVLKKKSDRGLFGGQFENAAGIVFLQSHCQARFHQNTA